MQPAALADELEQPAAAVVVVLVRAQVLGEVADALGEQRDLDLGGTGVAVVLLVVGDDLGLDVLGERHARGPPFVVSSSPPAESGVGGSLDRSKHGARSVQPSQCSTRRRAAPTGGGPRLGEVREPPDLREVGPDLRGEVRVRVETALVRGSARGTRA